jgi:pimeloyl-ACP methyl ester carboxylesterase
MLSSQEEKFIETANGKIFYYLTPRKTDKPTVVFLHGLTANHTQCPKIVSMLEEQGYSCLTPDLRGHGNSDKTKKRELYKIHVFVEDLREIIRQEKLESIILVGYSFGGMVALSFAAKYPKIVEKLVLISTNYIGPLKHWGIGFSLPMWRSLFGLTGTLLLWQRRKEYYYYRHDESLTYWRATILGFMTMPISLDLWMLRQVISINDEAKLPGIACETLLIQSKKEPFISKDEIKFMLKNIRKSEVVIAKNESHFIATEAQEETAEFILNFLNKHENSNL